MHTIIKRILKSVVYGTKFENQYCIAGSIRSIKIRKKFHHVKIYFASTCKVLLELFTVLMKLNQVLVFSSLFITQNS